MLSKTVTRNIEGERGKELKRPGKKRCGHRGGWRLADVRFIVKEGYR